MREMPAVKVIVLMGAIAFAFLFLTSLSMKSLVQSGGTKRVATVSSKSPFNAQRAFSDLKTVVQFGPRMPGSKPLRDLRGFIRKELTSAGLEVREHAFDASTPLGTIHMVNLIGIVKGTKEGIIILGNHYDTKYFADLSFVGANDGGSTTAWMMEMARTLGPGRNGRTVWLCFFDGEECFRSWSPTDGLYGSRAFVDSLRESGEIAQVKAMFNVDMIGDCFLGIKRDRLAPPWMNELVWNQARRLSYSAYFIPFADSVEDDHVPFRNAGIPAMDIIDFTYGATEADHRNNWHTANDTLEKVCPESLKVIGDVIYHVLPEVDAHLDKSPRG